MLLEIIKFEVFYRLKRPETYLFFGVLFLFSIVGVDFVFQGVEIGMVQKNAPLVIAKTMGAITGIFMIMASMIMGVPILRDFQHQTEPLLFSTTLTKRDYIFGRFLGSFMILLFVFSGVLFGMILGSQMPWHKANEMQVFKIVSYTKPFAIIVLPSLFFGACLFFVTGMLSKKLLVVYTQGIVLFVVFMTTKAIKNEYIQAILDPFSLTTLTKFTENWSVFEKNTFQISMANEVLYNKLFWILLGLIVLFIGYKKFSFNTYFKKSKSTKNDGSNLNTVSIVDKITIPRFSIDYNFKTQIIQFFELSKFYTKQLLKENSFWGIVICGIIIIIINFVNLGTVYGVDSYPETYFIVGELQETSFYFFIIILIFYSGELIWKEQNLKFNLIYDATSISDFNRIVSKFIALNLIYIVLLFSLILSGILFQITCGYYHFEISVYFSGFFLEIFPFLILYTFVAFFFQSISNHKFIGVLFFILFFIVDVGLEVVGFKHSFYNFGGKSLDTYSEMNGYGHFLKPYLFIKIYWFLFGLILLIISSLLSLRGTENSLLKRIKSIKKSISKPVKISLISLVFLFLSLGIFIFYNTNIINEYWTKNEQIAYRVSYEKTLKIFEYINQPKIIDVNLNLDLFPSKRAYKVDGFYILKNTSDSIINEIHLQQKIASHIKLEKVTFENGAIKNDNYKKFHYTIYQLNKNLQPGDSIKMSFIQSYFPKGFEDENFNTVIVNNGTFFNNQEFPTLGYNKKYELKDKDERIKYNLQPRLNKANITDKNELLNARSGGDANGINLEMIIGTSSNQTAITSGNLLRKWSANNRNYFHYKTLKPIINFYAIVSGKYQFKKDIWQSKKDLSKPVSLAIYHHPKHNYNTDRMLKSMKTSLDYFSKNFSEYQYQQLEIMEFPRYADFAQSFPNAIPFSESMGFVLDIDDEKDVDMVFYITAHEIAHQWFGMQVEAANVQGKNFILETLAQYAALMVFKNTYSEKKVKQFLDFQKELYLKNVKKSKTVEPTLALVENQDNVYYNKGVLAMYIFQQKVGEKKVNLALQNFLKDWNSIDGIKKQQTKRYATSSDLLEYFRAVTPKEAQPLIKTFFESNEELPEF
ncbi:ABC transporter permease/M1 family aminopeptidase [Polaribacter porphyrae]|uniref:Peptidase M1 n=1 Tax=Polaribacter porphyrae TaxID=1137780 RepID=A0A2S7WPA6_9FLAO|nr:M1 family aminopeptidase [Polaribacter porphyrae]PQJ79437.1 peptidase M1 [Polaribacter porphyrae]